MDAPVLSVVVPAFNEEGNVPYLLERLTAVLAGVDSAYEVIVVDDGSRDATWNAIREAAAADPRVRGLRLARNFGHQAALLAGLSQARGRAIISMDADLQHPPELIPVLLDKWHTGAAIVNTRRNYNAATSQFKKLSSALFYRVFSYMSGVEMQEGASDFRLMDRCVLDKVLRFQQSDLFLRGIVSWLDFPSATVAFEAADRLHGESKYSVKHMLRFANAGISAFSTKPLELGIFIGIFTSAFSFLFLLYTLLQYVLGKTVVGWASTLGLMSFLFGVLFVLLGIVGSYLGRIYIMLQNRPAFVIYEDTMREG